MSKRMLLIALMAAAIVAALVPDFGHGGAEAKRHSPPMYIALGDEVAIGAGLSDPDQSYVSLFHDFLEGRRGFHKDVELRNLAADNASIWDVAGTQLPVALAEIEGRRSDSDKKNDVRVVTIDAGLISGVVSLSAPTGRPATALTPSERR